MNSNQDKHIETARMDEEPSSKLDADSSVEGSIPSVSAKSKRKNKTDLSLEPVEEDSVEEEVVEEELVIVDPRYKLNFRRANGSIRADISKSVIYNLSVHWPDLVRVIPADRYVAFEEIVRLVKEWEDASPRKSIVRTPAAIEAGIRALMEAGILLRSV